LKANIISKIKPAPTIEMLDLIEARMSHEANENFYKFRQFMASAFKKKGLKLGWFQREVCYALMQFFNDFKAGKRPILLIETPPQHGKSHMVVDFIAWVLGHDPSLQVIYTSISERLGIRANLRLQRIFDSNKYQNCFRDSRIGTNNVVTISNQQLRNREMLEMIGHDGSFRNTTINGQIVGEGLDIGVIDDPLKGREQANSKTIRDKTWDWLTDDFFTRFSEYAGFIGIATSWHIDGPLERLAKKNPDIKILKYPAIVESLPYSRTHADMENRKEGDALFPKLKSKEFLLERQKLMALLSWQSLYQQNPQPLGGNLIDGSLFTRYKVAPIIKYRIIYGDTALKTAEANDYSVLEEWGKGEDGKIYLLNLRRGKWTAPVLEKTLEDFWSECAARDLNLFGTLRKVKIEDKASGTGLIQGIKKKNKIPIEGIPRSVDKYTRWCDVSGYQESGYVCLPDNAPWVSGFIAENEEFTADDSHRYDDQIDPMMDAIKEMLAGNTLDIWENLA